MAEIVPLTMDHLREAGINSVPETVEGIAVTEGGQVLAIAGLYYGMGCQVIGTTITDAGRHALTCFGYKKIMVRACRRMMALAARRKVPVMAAADQNIAGARELLEHLGAVLQPGGFYKWN